MKAKGMIIVILALLFVITSSATASDASRYIGTIVSYVERIQAYPAVINDALCEKDRESYLVKMQELANLIMAANDAIKDAGLPNTLNLWAVYNAVTVNPVCGVHDVALSRADWSREELDRIVNHNEQVGAVSGVRMCGKYPYGMTFKDFLENFTDGRPCETVMAFEPERCSWILDSCFYRPDEEFYGNGGFLPGFNGCVPPAG